MTEELDFYATPGVMTTLAGLDRWLAGLPSAPEEMARVVQGLVLHPFWAAAYGVAVPAERMPELQIRSAAGMVERLVQMDGRPLTEARELTQRFNGNCRHFATLTVALLRRAGVAARARCGFAGYFEAGKWVDHWIVEHWAGGRWVTLDPQIDEVQRSATGMTADPADLPAGMFLPGGAAWLRCQEGTEDSAVFGILDMWGKWFIEGNVVRDLAALNKVEMLPWDSWGKMTGAGSGPDDAFFNDVSLLSVSNDFGAIRQRYQGDEGLRTPSRITSYRPGGPVEVDIAEIA